MPLVSVRLNLSEKAIGVVDALREECKVSTRAKVFERVIEELIDPRGNIEIIQNSEP